MPTPETDKPVSGHSAESPFLIAIAMPVLNESKYIALTFEQLLAQEFPMEKIEVVVGDGGSTDGTREIIDSLRGCFGRLVIADNEVRKPSGGRNVGVKNSTAPYLLVLDGHCHIPSTRLLADMIELFERTGADCLCRPQPLTPPKITPFQMAVAICRDSALGHKPGSEIYASHEGEVDPTSSGAMYRRSVFEKIGYFDEQFDACEDVDFNFRVKAAGLKAYLSPKLTIEYYPRNSLMALWRQMGRYGKGRFRFARKHGEFTFIQWFAGAATAGCAVGGGLSIFNPTIRTYFLTVVFLYLAMLVLFSLWLGISRRKSAVIVCGPAIFPTIHFGVGVGFLRGLLEFFFPPKSR